jgi:putative component of toxin-antitoxin plasmid stabilization module
VIEIRHYINRSGKMSSTIGREIVLLLCGGDKRKQASDIDRALQYLDDYKERSGIT